MTRILNHIRANAVAYLALFVALGGTSYAAVNLPAGSVRTKQLHNGAVTNRKLARHAVRAANLDPKSIAGHVADWARISASGQVLSSSPQATVTLKGPASGIYQISWHRPIPDSCIGIANPANGPQAPVTANTFGPDGQGSATFLGVETFGSTGANVPESFNVVVICR
jgi:hypothetical protein